MFEGEKEKLTQFWHELNRVATSRANPMKFFTFWNKLQKASNLGSYYLIGQWRGDPTTRDDALNCLKITSSQWCLSIDIFCSICFNVKLLDYSILLKARHDKLIHKLINLHNQELILYTSLTDVNCLSSTYLG